VYDSIARKRKDPGRLEQTGWREFRVNVFPIPARDTVRIRLTYAHVVRDDLGLETLELPLPVGAGVVGDLRVHATITAAHGLSGVDCPSNADAKTVTDGNCGEVTWGGDGVEPKGPFVVRAIPKRDGFDVTLLASRPAGSEDGWFVARVVPRLAEPPKIARDVVFVVDRSGSMSGPKMEQARAALLRGLDTLKPGDRFDVISFSSDVTPLGAGRLLPVTPENLDAARRAARDLSASGGTNIGAALGSAVALRSSDTTRLFAVVFLTDGDASVGETAPDRILAAWRETSGGTRLFALGVGADVKDFLLTKLAVLGRGDAQYVVDADELEVKLLALYDRVRTPLLLDPVVDTDGVEIKDREPRQLPDLFQGRALVVTGRYKGAGKATLHLRGRSGADEVKIDVPVEFPAETPDRPHVAQIWAKARVERLLDELRTVGGDAEIRGEITALGLRHQLVTPYTSFLVVEDGVKIPGFDEARVPDAAPGDTADASGSGGATGHFGTGVPSTSTARFAGASGRGGGGLGQGGGGGSSGTTKQTETSVMWALRWLKSHQSADGRWSSASFDAQCKLNRCDGAGDADGDIRATGLALLSFLGAGETHQSGTCRETVKGALKFLRDVQDGEGCYGPRTDAHFVRDHAIAALAMTEAYGMTGSRVFKEPAQRGVKFALAQRAPGGAWMRAAPRDKEIDVETTAWMIALLKSAKMSELDVDKAAMTDALAVVDPLTDKATGRVGGDDTLTAMMLLSRIFGGRTPDGDPAIAKGADLLAKHLPKWDPTGAGVDIGFWYFGGLAAFQIGGETWKHWNEAMKTALIDHERMETDRDERGSWDPIGAGAAQDGRVVATALGCLQMEVYYRYGRVLGVRTANPPPDPAPPTGK
jgi:Ca-activated chloride channel family protein